MEILTVIYFDI